ncbi:Rieske 2Fe-2S domain-containing protein [Dechloromonas sp. XY25]|uniref:Rieske 2Fe-2S domain-containing protein n=1 Tax=Dechloromonas hankyongensis TaxID=2908002 RepID=A0ABS9K342_9RHOO|nr:Rieske 2Fe-2S domain-containing protein [Dechloromonas hankyongensis]MCG2577551.1 Rieske 2Fe-2S domain-containing protein [Dechloromonas hankyongensis]
MAEDFRLICASDDLADAGKGVRFTVERYGRQVPAFVIRYRGAVYGYFNECGHVPAELDWMPGEFFDDSKLYLICSIHGALYAPDSGRCLGGRCQGKGLKPLKVREIDGKILLEQER